MVEFKDGELIWEKEMPPEDRRIADRENWKEIREFISESREYRAADSERQLNLMSDLSEIKAQCKKTNGRVGELEDWQIEVKTKISDKDKQKAANLAFITIVATVVMAISAVVMLLKK